MGQVEYPVELDDYFRTFDRKTRSAVRENIRGFGGALSSRGASLNNTIAGLPRDASDTSLADLPGA